MKNTTKLAAGLALMAGVSASAETAPAAQISNGLVGLRVYLPDPKNGFYRGTRFDWSGVISGLEYSGHTYFPPWFQRVDPKVHDFIYDGSDIVAGPCTAATGPAEEFSSKGKGLGFSEASAGGTFLKIGVGVLHKPDEAAYDMFRLYDLVDSGTWTTEQKSDGIAFRHIVAEPNSGYGYDYQKTVSLAKDRAQLILDHTLRNTGRRLIQTSTYNHNFLYLDAQAPGPDCSIILPFPIQASPALDPALAEVHGNRILFKKTLTDKERVYTEIAGFGAKASDYDVRIENRKLGVGMRITCNQPLSRCALWSIRAPLSLEPFIDMTIPPGDEFAWRIVYDFYTLPK